MRLSLVIASLLGLSSAGLSQGPPATAPATPEKKETNLCSLEAKPPKTTICVDVTVPVTPLAVDLSPATVLTIEIRHKSPWQKVTISGKLSAIEDPTGKQFDALVKQLLTWIPGFPVFRTPDASISTKRPGSEEPRPKGPLPLREVVGYMPFASAFNDLYAVQQSVSRLEVERLNRVSALTRAFKRPQDEAKAQLAGIAIVASPEKYKAAVVDANRGFQAAVDLFQKECEMSPPLSDATVNDLAKQLATAKTRLDRLKFITSSQLYFALAPEEQKRVEQELDTAVWQQNQIEAAAASLPEGESALATTLALVEAVRNDPRKSWFEQKQEFRETENRKADITISWPDPLAPAPAKIEIPLAATWKKSSPVSMSLGFAFSSLSKTEFGLATTRDPNLALTATDALKSRISSTTVRPVIFPVVLLHYDFPHKLPASNWGGAISGGVGADVSGSSPTGEFAFGGSARYRSLYFSGLFHLGRRKQLQDGFAVGEAAPSGFTPPMNEVWGKGFAFALTYRLPLP